MKLSAVTSSLLFAASLTAGSAIAAPSLGTILNVNGGTYYDASQDLVMDDGAQSFMLTDANGIDDDAVAYLLLEIAGYAGSNTFGIYDFTDDGAGNITIGDTLEIYQGSDSPLKTRTIQFDLGAGTATANGVSAMIDSTFGFYLGVPTIGETWYSHTILNADGKDHLYSYDISDNQAASDAVLGSDIVLAWEDLRNLGDQDFRDMVVGVADVAPVPAPATIALFGLGLLGFAASRRRKA